MIGLALGQHKEIRAAVSGRPESSPKLAGICSGLSGLRERERERERLWLARGMAEKFAVFRVFLGFIRTKRVRPEKRGDGKMKTEFSQHRRRYCRPFPLRARALLCSHSLSIRLALPGRTLASLSTRLVNLKTRIYFHRRRATHRAERRAQTTDGDREMPDLADL